MSSYSEGFTPHSDAADSAEVEVLEHYESNRERHKDERDTIQKKTFTKWVNKHLTKAGLRVDDLFVDLKDGYKLIALLEALTGERLNRENGYTRFHRIQNVQYCLDFLKRRNIKLVNIRPEDIVEGNGKLTLGLIWTIILNFQVSVIKQRQAEEHQRLLRETHHVVEGRSVTSTGNSVVVVNGSRRASSQVNAYAFHLMGRDDLTRKSTRGYR